MEIYKDVVGYEGIYKVSNFGNVKSFYFNKEKVLKQSLNKSGYLNILLSVNNVKKRIDIHQLVTQSFLNHKRCGMKLVVNHIDFNKSNNNLDNLEIVTTRENTNQKHLNSSSRYVGVTWNKRDKKWKSQIRVNGKSKYLGLFKDEIKASEAYQTALKNI